MTRLVLSLPPPRLNVLAFMRLWARHFKKTPGWDDTLIESMRSALDLP